MQFRVISKADLESVCDLDSISFDSKRKDGTYLKRTIDNLTASLELNPEGCFLAEETGNIKGYIFSRNWGKIGWIGTFGVHPEFQNSGIGKRLIGYALDKLKSENCTTIGLETMPDSNYNVGMYLKCGFKMAIPTVHLIKTICQNEDEFHFPPKYWEKENAKIFELSDKVVDGLNYDIEVGNAITYKWGKVLVFGEKGEYGFAILRTVPTHNRHNNNNLNIHVLFLLTNATKVYCEVLKTIEDYAFLNHYENISIAINGANSSIIDYLLKNGFTVFRTRVRMILEGEYNVKSGVDASRWAM